MGVVADSLRYQGEDALSRSIHWQGVESTLRKLDRLAVVRSHERVDRMPEEHQPFACAIPGRRPGFLRDAQRGPALGPATRASLRPGEPEGELRRRREDVGWNPLQPVPQGRNLVALEELGTDPLEQSDGAIPVATGDGMANGILNSSHSPLTRPRPAGGGRRFPLLWRSGSSRSRRASAKR